MKTDCTEWPKARTRAGYGVTAVGRSTKYVHRLEMEKHLGRSLERHEIVMHSCDNPACYNIDHLSVGTQADNMVDMKAKGRSPRGIDKPNGKLSDADVNAIRWFSSAGVRCKDIARLFKVHQSYISRISSGVRRPALEGN